MPFSPLISKIRIHNPNKKGSSNANRNYVIYIATREGVSLENISSVDDLLQLEGMNTKNLNEEVIHHEAGNQEYVEYMARRPKSQGLFGNRNTDDLKAVSSEIASLTQSGKIIYRGIISLSERDGEELGFRSIDAWNNYLQKVMPEIAHKLGISYDNTWVAAFHAEETHPHVHYMLWDNKDSVKSPYIHKATQQKIRIYLENEMFDDNYERAVRMAHMEELEELKKTRNHDRSGILSNIQNVMQEAGFAPGINYERLPVRPENEYLQKIADETWNFVNELPGNGRLAYKYLQPELKEQLHKIIDIVLEKNELKNSFENYLNSVKQTHELYGETHSKIDAEVKKAENDIRRRIGNRILNEIKPVVQQLQQPESVSEQKTDSKGDFCGKQQIEDTAVMESVQEETLQGLREEYFETTEWTDLLEQYYMENMSPEDEEEVHLAQYEAAEQYFFEEIFVEQDFPGEENQNVEKETAGRYVMEWNADYKNAMQCIYSKEPDIEKAFHLLVQEAQKGNVLAVHELAKLAERELIDAPQEEKTMYYNKSLEGFHYVYAHPGCKKSREEWTKRYAAYRIGKLYDFGKGEIEVDYEKAAKWYQQAGNNKYAEYSLAKLYLSEKIYVSEKRDLAENQEAAYHLLLDSASQAKANPFAAYELGNMYQMGNYVEIDEKEAHLWYEKALSIFLNMSEKSTDDALFYRLGDMYLTGKGTEIDAERGEKYIEAAARLGNDNAKIRLAAIYLDKEDEILKHTAVKLLTEASEKGNSLAQYKLGCIYADSENDKIYNMDNAIKYLEASAEQGNQFAQYRLGVIYSNPELPGKQDIDKAIKYLEASAEQGNQFAQYRLGVIYSNPELQEKYNIDKAVECLEASADQGNEYAQYRLGVIYSNPELPGKQDIDKAIKYLEKSAEQGNEYAQYRLGVVYSNPELPGKQDIDRAIKYLEASADQGNQFAQYRLGMIHSNSELPGRYNINRAIEYLGAAAKQGNQFAQCKLGCIYYFGKDVERNLELGKYWLGRASAQGNQFAKDILEGQVLGMGYSYCLLKGALSAMETLNRQSADQYEQLSKTHSKQAMKEKIMHDKEKEQDIW